MDTGTALLGTASPLLLGSLEGLVCEGTGPPSTASTQLPQGPALGSVWKVGSRLGQCLPWGLLGQVVEQNSSSVNRHFGR